MAIPPITNKSVLGKLTWLEIAFYSATLIMIVWQIKVHILTAKKLKDEEQNCNCQ